MIPDVGQIWRAQRELWPWSDFYWNDRGSKEIILPDDLILVTQRRRDASRPERFWIEFTRWGVPGDITEGTLKYHFLPVDE
jgi:hypothetical protein